MYFYLKKKKKRKCEVLNFFYIKVEKLKTKFIS